MCRIGRVLGLGWVMVMILSIGNDCGADGAISQHLMQKIYMINKNGPYLGIVVPNSYELNPLLNSSSFFPHPRLPYLDFAGRRFRIGTLENQKVIVVMCGLSMLNAGIATQLLLSAFKIKGVLHYGIAGNANPDFEIGDVTIPRYWAHSGLWNWQRYGDGPHDELAFESGGDYTREYGFLNISGYQNVTTNGYYTADNFLNNVWYQPEEIFPVDGQPEIRQHAFWVPVDNHYFSLADKLEDTILERCVNTTCLPRPPKVYKVERGLSANVLVDNAAYRSFLYSKFKVTPIEMESAGVALICFQQRVPFIIIRSLSDLAGGGSSLSNEAEIFSSLASQNAFNTLRQFVALLPQDSQRGRVM